jgi:predicted thioesterase
MLYYMECAAYEAIKNYLEPGDTVLGVRFDFEHLAPTPAGCLITARAEVTGVQDDLVTFAVEAHDEHEVIGKGTHVRRIVNRDRFDKRLNAKRT